MQQDNARPHTLVDDHKILAAGRIAGFNIRVAQQPSNSPDLNVLDLGLFNAIDKIQRKIPRCNLDELIASVQYAFDTLPPTVINRAFVSLQGVMEQIILHDGDNNFPTLHMRKRKTEKEQGDLPFQHHLSAKARRKALKLLRKRRRNCHIEMWGDDDSNLNNELETDLDVQLVTSTEIPDVQLASSTDPVPAEDHPPPFGMAVQQQHHNNNNVDVVMIAQQFSI